MSGQVTGGCQCEAVRYAFEGPVPAAYACHCGECKKQTASAFSMSVPMRFSALTVEGKVTFFETIADSGKIKYNHFCGKCGTRLWHTSTNPPDAITLKVGTLDDPEEVILLGQLWVSKKQPGIDLDPTGEQHLTQPTDLDAWRVNLERRS